MPRTPRPVGDPHRSLARAHQRAHNLERRSPGPYKFVGDPDFCDFITGRNADPSAQVPNPSPFAIRHTLGAGLEIVGDVTDLAPGDLVCIFPVGYRPLKDRPASCHDDNGNYVACRFLTTGHFYYGVP